MIDEKRITLALLGQTIEGRIVSLTPELSDEKISAAWWNEACLKNPLDPSPIDRYWNWNTHEIIHQGQALRAEKVAAVTGEGEDLAVQGAMMVSTEPIDSVTGRPCLLVELLFTAPRNRPVLRRDGQQYIAGIGTQLLIWAAWMSQKLGYEGRLRLDGSPDFVTWYEKRGLQKVDLDPIVYEDVSYTPMELSEQAAEELVSLWEED